MEKDKILKLFGEKTRSKRIKLALSQKEVALKAGLHPVYLNGVEQGIKNISLSNINRLATALNTPIEKLLSLNNLVRFKGIIFDLHHTLIHLNPSRGIIYNSIFNKYDLNANPKKIEKAFSETWHEYGDKIISHSESKLINKKLMEEWWFHYHFKMLEKIGFSNEQKARLINKEISNQFWGNPKIHRIYKDAEKILPFLKNKGIKLGLITNSYKSAGAIIKYFGLEKYFDCIVISCNVGLSKPNPKIFKLAVQKLLLKPSEILCIGDSYPTDIIGAKKAGCGVAIIDRKNKNYKKAYDCIYLNNLKQIKNLIG